MQGKGGGAHSSDQGRGVLVSDRSEGAPPGKKKKREITKETQDGGEAGRSATVCLDKNEE